MNKANESGFTLIEVLVAMFLFALVSAGLYSVMLSGIRGANTTEQIVRISEEARLGFNRMVRDTREAARIVDVCWWTACSSEFLTIHIDFNADGLIDPVTEEETIAYDPARQVVTLNGEVLMTNVRRTFDPITGATLPIFDYTSNQLQFDHNPQDGVARWEEVDRPPLSVTVGGNGNGRLDAAEFPYLTNVTFAMELFNGTSRSQFFTEAQLRNARTVRT